MDIFNMAEALTAQVATATAAGGGIGLRPWSWEAESVSPPAFVIHDLDVTFDLTFGRGLDLAEITARLYVGHQSDRAAHKLLKGYLAGSGSASVYVALNADKTLSGTATTLKVNRIGGYGTYDYGTNTYLGAEFQISVWGKGG